MTQITARLFSKEEFDSKEAELGRLASVIDLWGGTEMSVRKQETIQAIFDDLAKNLYAIDCAFLEAKLVAYKEIEELIKA